VQIERILLINELTVITEDVVEAARSTLVIGLMTIALFPELCYTLLSLREMTSTAIPGRS
jgi:hypothetical protein